MKVLQVIDRLNIGGAERVCLDLLALLRDQQVQADILLISGKGPLFGLIDPRASILELNRNSKYSLKKLFECAAICAKYEIVHVHMRYTYTYVRLAQLVSFRRFKIIFHDHYGDILINTAVPAGLGGIFKPELYIGVSQRLVDWALNNLKVRSNKCFLLRNTIIPDQSVRHADKEYDWVMVSNIRKTKNIEHAIKMAQALKKKLVVFGNVTGETYSDKILRLIDESAYVTLIQGETSIQSLLPNFKLAIHTAYSETGPLVLMEYLAAGLPFLAHFTGEVALVLKKELPGCFIEGMDESEWKQQLIELENNPPSPTMLKNLFNKYFGPTQYIEKCLKIYEQVKSY